MKFTRKRLSIVLGIVALILLLVVGTSDNRYTNARYILWKSGLAPTQYDVGLHYMVQDVGFRASLTGKTLPDVSRLFPILIPPSQTRLSRPEMTDINTRWIGNSQWAIRLRDGRIVDVDLYKG